MAYYEDGIKYCSFIFSFSLKNSGIMLGIRAVCVQWLRVGKVDVCVLNRMSAPGFRFCCRLCKIKLSILVYLRSYFKGLLLKVQNDMFWKSSQSIIEMAFECDL